MAACCGYALSTQQASEVRARSLYATVRMSELAREAAAGTEP